MGSELSKCDKIFDRNENEGCKLFCIVVMNNLAAHKSKLMTICDDRISLMGNVTVDEGYMMRRGVRKMCNLFFPSGEGTHCPSRPGPKMPCFCGKAHRGLCYHFAEGVYALLEKQNSHDALSYHATPCTCSMQCGCTPPLKGGALNSYKAGVKWADVHFSILG